MPSPTRKVKAGKGKKWGGPTFEFGGLSAEEKARIKAQKHHEENVTYGRHTNLEVIPRGRAKHEVHPDWAPEDKMSLEDLKGIL